MVLSSNIEDDHLNWNYVWTQYFGTTYVCMIASNSEAPSHSLVETNDFFQWRQVDLINDCALPRRKYANCSEGNIVWFNCVYGFFPGAEIQVFKK